jgi:hypothetical protein
MSTPEELGYTEGTTRIPYVRKYWYIKQTNASIFIMRRTPNRGTFEVWTQVPDGTGNRYFNKAYQSHGPYPTFEAAALAAKFLASARTSIP